MEPLSQAELLEVIEQLQAAVEANPRLANTPLFVGTMRLALSARAAPPPVDPLDAPAPSLEVALLAAARAQLTAEVAEKEGALAKVEIAGRVVAAERVKLASAQKSLTEAAARAQALQADVTRLTATLAAQDAIAPALHADVLQVVRSYEWASKKPVVHKGATREVPCCPGCGGLSPEGLPKGVKEVGHRENCWYAYVINRVAEHKP